MGSPVDDLIVSSPGYFPEILSAVEEFVTGSRHAVDADRMLCTILFTDIVGSTEMVAEKGDRSWSDLLDLHNATVRQELSAFKGREMNTTGDGFVAVFDGPARAIQCAGSIRESMDRLGVGLRLGLHSGECEAEGDSLSGLAFHIASRISDKAPPGEILVSRTVRDLVAGQGSLLGPYALARMIHQPEGVSPRFP